MVGVTVYTSNATAIGGHCGCHGGISEDSGARHYETWHDGDFPEFSIIFLK